MYEGDVNDGVVGHVEGNISPLPPFLRPPLVFQISLVLPVRLPLELIGLAEATQIGLGG